MSNQTRSGPLRSLECPPGTEYDEEAFLYFLALEQSRAARMRQPLPVLLATLEPEPGRPATLTRADAAKLFNGLRASIRDTDVMGWYRQGRVAGVVLSAPASSPDTASTPPVPVEQRIGDGLRKALPAKLARTLQVRLVQQQGPRRFEHD
jgi:hypothetical protein